jgi:carbon-monoxide dehydrogenase medium subunit
VKPPRFEYVRAGSVDEALESLAVWNGEARLLAGGQSLVPLLNARLARPAALVDVNGVPGLDDIREENGAVVVGALVRHSALEWSPLVGTALPLLAEAVRFVGDRQIRNRGTMGGSLAHADPTAELAVAALALGATILARSRHASVELPASDFFRGPYTTALEDGTMVTGVSFPRSESAVSAFVERSRRHGDFAVISVAAVGVPGTDGAWQSLRLGLGGAAGRPRLGDPTELVSGTALEPDVVRAVGEACVEASSPFSDVRASADYRRHLIPIYVERAIDAVLTRWKERPT